MGELELANLPIGILIIPVAIIATLFALYLLGRHWRKSAEANMKQLRSEFRQYHSKIQALSLTVQEYDDIQQEPFTSRVGELQSQINEIRKQLAELQSRYVSIQEQIHKASSNPFKSILGSPVFWNLTRRDISNLEKDLASKENLLQNAGSTETSLRQLGWEVAQKAREASAIDNQVKMRLERLASKKIYGDIFEKALQEEAQARDSLTHIPHFFMNADEETVLEQAEEESITQAHRVLASTRPLLDALLQRVQNWEKQYNEAQKVVTRMRRVLAGLEGALIGAPLNLDLEVFNQRLDGLNIISQNLHATLSRLEVESIPVVIEEAKRVQRSAQEMEISLKQVRLQMPRLETKLNELDDSLKELSIQTARLAASEVYPLIWDSSQAALTELNQWFRGLEPPDQPRTIEQVSQDLETATRLTEDVRELTLHCQNISEQHRELERLLEISGIKRAKEWFHQARQMLERMKPYASENWPSSDEVDTLPEDLDEIESKIQKLIFEQPAKPILENDLATRLEETRALVESYQLIRGRVGNVRRRLDEIQNLEKHASEQLKISEAVLTQLTYIVGSNTYLDKIAGGQLSRLEDNLSRTIDDLNHREKNTLEKKARKIDTLASKIESSARSWFKKLNKETQNQSRELAKSLSALDDIALIDEKPLHDARQLLQSSNRFINPDSTKIENFNDLIQELKRQSDYWQECSAVRKALRDIEEPVIESFTYTDQSREYVYDQFSDLEDWLSQTRDWPPTNVTLETEELELKNLEAQWNALKGSQTKAITLVQRLGNLGGKYQILAERIMLAGERVADEQRQIEELEKELAEYEDQWETQLRLNKGNSRAENEIEELLANSERDYEQIKKDYRKGEKSYQEVVNALQLLNRRVRLAQVSLDEAQMVGIDGRVIG